MASNPPGKCCFEGFYHEGQAKGTHKDVCGVDTYVTGAENSSDRVIVILTDIYGNRLNNVLLTADQMATDCHQVYIPDILFNDPVVALDGSTDFNAWLAAHPAEKVQELVTKYLTDLRAQLKPKFLAVVGYCYGAKFAIQQIGANPLADCCAIAHPSFVSIEEVDAISKPVLISAAEEDPIFPEELRHQTEAKLKENKARYQLDLFSGVSHGFAARGDTSNPVVKYAKEKVLVDQLYWFNYFSGCCQK